MSLEKKGFVCGKIKFRIWEGDSLKKNKAAVVDPTFRGQIIVIFKNGKYEEELFTSNLMYLLEKIKHNSLSYRGKPIMIIGFGDGDSKELARKLDLPLSRVEMLKNFFLRLIL